MRTEELLTNDDVAEMLRVKPSTVAGWRRQGTGPKSILLAYNVVRYRREDVDAWLETRAA